MRARRMGVEVLEGYFDFETDVGHGTGFVRLVPDDCHPHEYRAWLLLTALHELHGNEERVKARRPTGDEFSQITSPTSWRQIREQAARYDDRDPQVLVVGGGQGGLILAARLQQMGADVLVVDKRARIGDVWRNRYNNLTLHNEIVANHFPYLPFPETWPMWLPKDMLADWLESYAKFLELNVWTSTEVVESRYDEASGEWELLLRRADRTTRKMRCKHVVIATGVSGDTPKKPRLPGQENFKGEVLHSSEFHTGRPWAGKHAVVIGTGNSGHDVAQDLHVSGAASVTVMQRGATCVASLSPSARIIYAAYMEGRPAEDVDLMSMALPYSVLVDAYKRITIRTKQLDKELIDRLHAAGFKTHNGADETGFQMMYMRGAGGYYIDVGCCELIANKQIGLIQAEDFDTLTAQGLRMKDGTVRPVDLIVLATGFEGMRTGVGKVLGHAVAEKIGRVWGFDEDGVMHNMWRRTGQQGVWLMGGALTEARTYSRYLALEIVADLKGVLPSRAQMPWVCRRGGR